MEHKGGIDGMGTIEFKGGGFLLALDGELTPEGKARGIDLKPRQTGADVEFKVINPPEASQRRSVDPATRASLQRSQRLATEIQGSIDAMKRRERRPLAATDPTIRRGLRLLSTIQQGRKKR